MKKFILFCVTWVSFPLWCQSEVRVVFLEVKNEKGQTVYLEPDFPYAHVVIGFEKSYLHSHPRSGVSSLSPDELTDFGDPKETFYLPDWGINPNWIEEALGKSYDSEFSWGDERYYCSELVAKAIGIEPEPMHFDPKLWPPHFQQFEGLPGISPGKIFEKLKAGAFLLKKSLSYSPFY